MSLFSFFVSRGETPITKSVTLAGTDTATVWAPLTGKRVYVTNLNIASGPAGTVAFYFDTTTAFKIAEFTLGGSATISPDIGGWESTVVSGRIFARLGASSTEGTKINLTGFEIGG